MRLSPPTTSRNYSRTTNGFTFVHIPPVGHTRSRSITLNRGAEACTISRFMPCSRMPFSIISSPALTQNSWRPIIWETGISSLMITACWQSAAPSPGACSISSPFISLWVKATALVRLSSSGLKPRPGVVLKTGSRDGISG